MQSGPTNWPAGSDVDKLLRAMERLDELHAAAEATELLCRRLPSMTPEDADWSIDSVTAEHDLPPSAVEALVDYARNVVEGFA